MGLFDWMSVCTMNMKEQNPYGKIDGEKRKLYEGMRPDTVDGASTESGMIMLSNLASHCALKVSFSLSYERDVHGSPYERDTNIYVCTMNSACVYEVTYSDKSFLDAITKMYDLLLSKM